MASYVSHTSAIATSSEEEEDHIAPDSVGVVKTTSDGAGLLDPAIWPHHTIISEPCSVTTLEKEYDFDSLERLVSAGEELVERGAAVVVTDCGFSSMQREVARRLRVPVVCSAMVQLASLAISVPGGAGVVTIDRQQISQWHLIQVGADPELPIIGMHLDSPWRADLPASVLTGNLQSRYDKELDARLFEELSVACDELVSRYQVGAIVLEEPKFAGMTFRLQRRLPVRVFDVVSCVGWLHAGHRTLAKQSSAIASRTASLTSGSMPASPRAASRTVQPDPVPSQTLFERRVPSLSTSLGRTRGGVSALAGGLGQSIPEHDIMPSPSSYAGRVHLQRHRSGHWGGSTQYGSSVGSTRVEDASIISDDLGMMLLSPTPSFAPRHETAEVIAGVDPDV
ncbi:hypothetical protein PYCC9005_003936 [Savitreella phatthalungensis]